MIPGVNFPTAGGDAAWARDGRGFWYTRYPGAERPEADRRFYVQVYFHAIGSDPSKDARVFGDGLPKVAEIQLDYSPEADALLVSVQDGDGGEFSHYVSRPDGGFTQVTRFKDGVDFAAFGPDAALYLVSERNAPRRQILKLAPGVRDLAKATTIVPQGEDAIPINFFGEDPLCFVGKRMYVRLPCGRPDAAARLRPRRHAGGRRGIAGGRGRGRDRAARRRPALQRRDLPRAGPLLPALRRSRAHPPRWR